MEVSLARADLERMRREHVPATWPGGGLMCAACEVFAQQRNIDWPCDAALLLAFLARLQISHSWPGANPEENRRNNEEAQEYLANFGRTPS